MAVDPLALWTAYFSGTLGSIGAITVIIAYMGFPEMRTTSRSLVFVLSLCDLGVGLRFLTLDLDVASQEMCVFQSVWGLWVTTAAFFWTASIAIYVFAVIRAPNIQFPSWGLILFHVLSWGYPTLFALINFFDNARSVASPEDFPHGMLPWCYMSQRWWIGWRIIGFTYPLLTSWLVTGIMYWRSKHLIENFQPMPSSNAQTDKYAQSELQELRTKFSAIPLIFVCLRSFDAIQNVWMLFMGPLATPFPLWFQCLQIFGDASQGFFNCIIFIILTAAMRTRLLGDDTGVDTPLKPGLPVYVHYNG